MFIVFFWLVGIYLIDKVVKGGSVEDDFLVFFVVFMGLEVDFDFIEDLLLIKWKIFFWNFLFFVVYMIKLIFEWKCVRRVKKRWVLVERLFFVLKGIVVVYGVYKIMKVIKM